MMTERITTQTQDWLTMLDDFASLARREGLSVNSTRSPDQVYFTHLSDKDRQFVFETFAHYLDEARQIDHEGLSLCNSSYFLGRMLTRLDLYPQKDLFSHITGNELVEIYDTHSRQIFRSLNYLSVCSYSLDEILCRPWWELFAHDKEILEHLTMIIDNVLKGNLRQTQFIHAGPHIVDEIDSPRMLHAEVNYKIISPLRDAANSHSAGFVSILEVLSCKPRR